MTSKRAYKLQEFVAHASSVNCVKFGRRSSRLLITGGEDRKVNLWAVGKPTALLSLTGLTSPVESVGFDSSEVTIGAGAASGTIKIWDFEEAKVVRTFTGHRSNCASVDFHPFGEFLASGSSDTNMKIWDIRKKRCIHTYKGHTRQINVLKFTPDGRWIVSGGADNSVKIWDLTAGKLLHEFNLHGGPINCLDFHPHEFLLATGSADKTVKFWDLETFELIGSSGPENSREYFSMANVVREMKFNCDGKTLFCGLRESLKVLSWEPIICHDVADVGWSTLADFTVDDGKLLGCSYNQNCVGVWVLDLLRIEPYAVGSAESYFTGSVNSPLRLQADSSISSVSKNPASEIAHNTQLNRSISASKEILVSASSTLTKRLSEQPKTIDLRLTRSDSAPFPSPGVGLDPISLDDKRQHAAVELLSAPKFNSIVDLSSNAGVLSQQPLAPSAPTNKSRSHISIHSNKASSSIPVLVPRHDSVLETSPILGEPTTGDIQFIETDDVECNKAITERSLRSNLSFDFRMRASESQNVHGNIFQSKTISAQRNHLRETSGHAESNFCTSVCTGSVDSYETGSSYVMSCIEKWNSAARDNPNFTDTNRSAVLRLSKPMESSGRHAELRLSSANFDRQASIAGRQSKSTTDENAMAALMENHQEFIHVMKSRKTKLEEACQCWGGNIKEFLDAMLRISDCAVTADIISILTENNKCFTLDTSTSLLRLASSLLESMNDRYLSIALEVILKLVKSFGATIPSSLSATPPVGVDLEAEHRLERCHLCFQEMKKATWRGWEIGTRAEPLSSGYLSTVKHIKQ